MADSGYAAGTSIVNAFRDQPLLFGALGLAIGAAIGAALPRTQTENEYMGPASDALKEQAQDVASEQYAYVKEAAENTVEKVKSEAEKQGLTGEGWSGMMAKAGAVADTAMKTAEKEMSKASDAMSSQLEKRAEAAAGSEKKDGSGSSGQKEGSGSRTGSGVGSSRPSPSEIT